jgi:hypothetical protein
MAKKKAIPGYLQQGDVYLYPGELPKGKLTPVKPTQRGFVLAEGEATGHAHTIEAEPEVEISQDAEGTMWLGTKKEVVLKHEEHGHVKVPPGTYKIGRVREIDPLSREIEAVRD